MPIGRISSRTWFVLIGALPLVGAVVVLALNGFVQGTRPAAAHNVNQSVALPEVVGALPLLVSHQFEIANETPQVIEATTIESNCSCTSHSISASSIQPGASVLLDMNMSMYVSGRRTAEIMITWSTGERSIYTLAAQARALARLGSPVRWIEVGPDKPASLEVWLSLLDTDTPVPVIENNLEGITTSFAGWRGVSKGDARSGIGRRLTSAIWFEATKDAKGGWISIAVEGAEPILIDVRTPLIASRDDG